MSGPTRIRADVHERRGRVPDRLAAAGADLSVERLPVGDYDLGDGVLVERKTTADLHESLRVNRFWPQLGKLRAAARVPVLLVEGPTLAGRIGERAVRGALLAAVDLRVLVVRAIDADDTAAWLAAIARRHRSLPVVRVRTPYARPYGRLPVSVAMLAVVPGISPAIAQRLLDQFGSAARVLAASETDLRSVRGMGPKRSAALRAAAVSPLSRSESGPAAHPSP